MNLLCRWPAAGPDPSALLPLERFVAVTKSSATIAIATVPRGEREQGAKSAPPKKIPAGILVPVTHGDRDGEGVPGPAEPH
ncbi:hypothetical protein SLEP1_g11548 [Rubroshorea leprosula]|nr:hypothetical protein SLEP1_g11548 [Rubroshorea leprosula]